MRAARITGWGSDLPEKVLTNDDLSRMMDTNDEWIRERTGISSRRVGGSTVGMAVSSGRQALERAGVDPADIDLVVLATTSPDQMIPASSAAVQAELGLQCGAVDMNAACSGFVYALVTGYLYVRAGLDRVLVIGSDAMSAWTDYEDRGTAILFGDGAGAVVLEATDTTEDGADTLLGWDLGADGTARHILYADHGDKMKMDGKEVFRRAVRAMVASSERAMANAGVTIDDIAWVIPHQANIRIVESAVDKLGCPRERLVTVLEHTGNTSSGSIPLALVAAVDDGRVQPGDLLLLTGFGAGMTWASAIVRWQP
jgi:3-oxoacyl-[acyl-carrier-protein] synthase-3